MSGNFDWQTDEELDWDVPSSERQPQGKRPFRHWRTLFILVVVLIGTGSTLYWNINRRAQQGEMRLRLDLIASQEFVAQAGADGEADLFRSSLSGRDMGWVETMSTVVSQQRYRNFPMLGLEPTGEAAPIQAAFEADFSAVNVLQPVSYTVNLPDGNPQTVSLSHFEVYRRGRNGWLLSRHSPSMWGDPQTIQAEPLSVTYPEWDAELVARLTPELAELLLRMCQELMVGCEDDFVVSLTFSTEAESLLTLAEPERLLRQRIEVTLPTPTLVGKPVNEAAYEALLRGYARALLTAVMAEQIDYRCCTQYLFFQALVDYQLAELGLWAWPVSDEDYAAALETGFSFLDLELLWEQTPLAVREHVADETAVYLAIDYLMRDYAAGNALGVLAERQQQLAVISYGTWLLNWVTAVNEEVANPLTAAYWLDEGWRELAQGEAAQPIPPMDSLLLACQQNGSREMAAVQFNLAQQQWQTLTTPSDDFFFISSLPDNRSIFFHQVLADETSPDIIQLTLWQDGQSLTEFGPLSVTFGEASPNGRFVVGYAFVQDGNPTPYLIDLQQCSTNGCPFSPLGAIPNWSPNGQRTFLRPADVLFNANIASPQRAHLRGMPEAQTFFPFQIGDERGNPLSETSRTFTGYHPLWLDDDRLAFIQPLSGLPGELLLVYDVRTQETAVLTTTTDLLEALSLDQLDANWMHIQFMLLNPANPAELLLVLFDERSQELLFVSFDRQTSEMTLLQMESPADLSVTSLDPNGRFLLTTIGGELFNGANQLLLLDRDEGKTAVFPYDTPDTFFIDYLFDWHPNGEWLAVSVAPNTLLLHHPATNTQHLIPHEQGACYQIAWQLSTP